MPLDTIINGEAASSVRSKLNAAIGQVNTNVTDIAGKQPLDADLTAIAGLSPVNNDTMQYISGGWKSRTVSEAKTTLGLNNVDNTSDANKPVSTATQTALDAKQDENAADTTIWRVNYNLDADQSPAVGDNKRFYVFITTIGRAFNVPNNSTQAFAIGTEFRIFNSNTSLADVTVTPAGGVTVLYANGAGLVMAAQTSAHLTKVDTNVWALSF